MGFKISIKFGGESEEERIYKECMELIDKVALTKDRSERLKLIKIIRAKMKLLPVEKRIKLMEYAHSLRVGI